MNKPVRVQSRSCLGWVVTQTLAPKCLPCLYQSRKREIYCYKLHIHTHFLSAAMIPTLEFHPEAGLSMVKSQMNVQSRSSFFYTISSKYILATRSPSSPLLTLFCKIHLLLYLQMRAKVYAKQIENLKFQRKQLYIQKMSTQLYLPWAIFTVFAGQPKTFNHSFRLSVFWQICHRHSCKSHPFLYI